MNRVERQVVGAESVSVQRGGPGHGPWKINHGQRRGWKTVFRRPGSNGKGFRYRPGIVEGPAVVLLRAKKRYGSVRGRIDPGSGPRMEPSLIELLPLCRRPGVRSRGGRLNPTATTAREYGIPVVTSLWCVTDAIRHGDLVRISTATTERSRFSPEHGPLPEASCRTGDSRGTPHTVRTVTFGVFSLASAGEAANHEYGLAGLGQAEIQSGLPGQFAWGLHLILADGHRDIALRPSRPRA